MERKLLSFIQVKAKPGIPPKQLATRITALTGLAAYTKSEFEDLTISYFMKYTGIPKNFGFAVILGFLVGTAIAGMMFYNFTLENLKYFAALKAMGATNLTLLVMVVVQALLVGGIGFGLGTGAAAIFGKLLGGSELAFRLLWQTLAISGGAIALICILASLLSIQKVMRLEPAIVFKS